MCPQWFARSPFVASIFSQLEDFKKGRMGPVQAMPIPLHRYLRAAAAEAAAAQNYWDEERLGAIKDGHGG